MDQPDDAIRADVQVPVETDKIFGLQCRHGDAIEAAVRQHNPPADAQEPGRAYLGRAALEREADIEPDVRTAGMDLEVVAIGEADVWRPLVAVLEQKPVRADD